MPSSDQERLNAIKTINEMIDQIDYAMLTTVMPDGMLRSRPMIAIDQKFDGDLYFFTEIDTTKVSEVEDNPNVNVGYASPQSQRYVSISGTAELLRDERKAEALWEPKYSNWFLSEVEVAKLGLLRVSVEQAEYWNASASRMVQIANFAKGIFGNHPEPATKHGKIEWTEDGRPSEHPQKAHSS